MTTVISVENLSKSYRLGQIGTGTFSRDLEAWWAKMRGKPNPMLRIGEADHGNREGEELWALKDVSFTVGQGEVLGIIGRNGAGKSTLLKILSRVTAPTSGKIKVKGRIASLLEVGTGFHPELTGRENIYLNGAILGMSRQEVTRKFDEIVDFAGVEKFIDTPVKRYSSGMYVRLAFAVAAHLESEILLVDEVLAVGDADFQKKCLGKMGNVAQEGRTVLFVSHNMGAVRKLCQRGILLSFGNLLLDNEIESTLERYINESSSILTPCVELPEQARNMYGENLGRATRLSFYTMDGQQKAEFRLWESWKILLEFEIMKHLRHAVAAIGISTSMGIPVVTYWTEPKELQPGKYKAEFLCDVPLKASDLTVGVGLSEAEKAFYFLENQGHITINHISTREQPFKTSGAGLLLSNNSPKIIRIE